MVNGWVNAKIHSNLAIFWGFELFSWVVLPGIIFGYLFKFQHITWDDLGLHNKINRQKNLGTLVFLCVLAVLFTYPLDKIFTRIAVAFVGYIPPYFYYQSMQPNMLLLKWLSTIYFALSAGIVEELYYRGLFYKIAESTSNPKLLYLLLSPAIFAIAHWEQGMDNVLETYLFGIIASLFYLKFKNLWPLIFGHVVTDYVWFSA
jgi:membrane protease YdiL (CAAX protease family)